MDEKKERELENEVKKLENQTNELENQAMEFFIYTPELFLEDVNKLNLLLQHEKFDAILAIARGGLVLATILSNLLQINELFTIQLKSYCKMEQKEMQIIYEPNWSLLSNKKLLIVDDLIDHGQSMLYLISLLEIHDISNYKIAVLIDKEKHNSIRANYCAHHTKRWVKFFWERSYFE
jgi:hypoxanthine phosphoribosyltransferase